VQLTAEGRETFVVSFVDSHYVPATPELEEKIELQKTSYHWHPYKRIIFRELEEGNMEVFCKPPGSSIDEFPQFFDRKSLDSALFVE
jgi:hypothetical protein